MAEKQSILGRIAQLARANVNALIDQAEDPQKMLDQMVRDYTSNIAEAERAVAQTIGNLRLAEQDRAEDEAAVREWGGKAAAASRKADSLRAEGKDAEADRFDELAKVALKRQISFEQEVTAAGPQIAAQTEVVDKLKAGLTSMKQKLEELKRKRDQLVARQKAAEAQSRVQDAVGSLNVLDPTSELSRFEERVRREEARVAGQAELQADSLEAQFASLEDDAADLDVEARLAALKAGGSSS
ncbi:PspA/IM30 family protein [Kineococcus sp. SYSU DK004]|uniref:PspA/IM30 family protein n=1 Tax=Kineococcus sp. SYSU DK004 TaxID=3383125 RepID=UPI003D7E827E